MLLSQTPPDRAATPLLLTDSQCHSRHRAQQSKAQNRPSKNVFEVRHQQGRIAACLHPSTPVSKQAPRGTPSEPRAHHTPCLHHHNCNQAGSKQVHTNALCVSSQAPAGQRAGKRERRATHALSDWAPCSVALHRATSADSGATLYSLPTHPPLPQLAIVLCRWAISMIVVAPARWRLMTWQGQYMAVQYMQTVFR